MGPQKRVLQIDSEDLEPVVSVRITFWVRHKLGSPWFQLIQCGEAQEERGPLWWSL